MKLNCTQHSYNCTVKPLITRFLILLSYVYFYFHIKMAAKCSSWYVIYISYLMLKLQLFIIMFYYGSCFLSSVDQL